MSGKKGDVMELFEAQSLASLILKEDLTQKTKFADRIGYTRSYLYEIEKKPLTQDFIEIVEAKLGIKLNTASASSELHTKNDGAEMMYWEKGLKYGDYTRSSKLRSVWTDKEIIKGFWNCKSINLRCIRVFDDRMEGGIDPLEEGDIVLIDTAKTDYTNGGVFLYTAELNGFKILRIARIAVKAIEGVVVFSWNNSDKYSSKTYTKEDLVNAKFVVQARVIHNATRMIR